MGEVLGPFDQEDFLAMANLKAGIRIHEKEQNDKALKKTKRWLKLFLTRRAS